MPFRGLAGHRRILTRAVELARERWGRREVFFLARHGVEHARAPHQVPHHAHVAALAGAHVDWVLAVNNVGSLRTDIRPRRWLIPHDFLGMMAPSPTFHEDEPVHADLTEPYCPHVRSALIHAAGPDAYRSGVYAGTTGPRFETAAEVAALARLGGDVVGMTGVPEAILAREKGLCYAALCWVGNRAAGLQARVSARGIVQGLAAESGRLRRILRTAVEILPAKKTCRCARRTAQARVAPPSTRRRP